MDANDAAAHRRRIQASRRRSIATLLRTIDTVGVVIDQNERMAEGTDGQHRQSALRRVREGNRELAVLRDELAALRDEEATQRR